MKKTLLKKALAQSRPALRLWLCSLGLFLGLILFFLSLELVWAMLTFDSSKSGASSEFLVINKKMDATSGLFPRSLAFSERDIELLRKQSFVMDLAPVQANQFHAFVSLGFSQGVYGSDVFFEALPDRFLDAPKDRWSWTPGQSEIPIIVGRDFLTLYNLGFAGSRGLPRVTEDSARAVPLTLVLTGSGKKVIVPARITGFSDRLASLLVPDTFMRWANREIADQSEAPVLRLVMEVRDPSLPQITVFLEENGWETNRDRLRFSPLVNLALIVLGFMGVFGGLLTAMALLLMVVSLRLYWSENRAEWEILKDLGASPKLLISQMSGGVSTFIVGFATAGLITAAFISWLVERMLQSLALSIHLFIPAPLALLPVLFVIPFFIRKKALAVLYPKI